MPAANRARLADLGLQKLDPKKPYTKTGKNGLFIDEVKPKAIEKKIEEVVVSSSVLTKNDETVVTTAVVELTGSFSNESFVKKEDVSVEKKPVPTLEVPVDDTKKENKQKKQPLLKK